MILEFWCLLGFFLYASLVGWGVLSFCHLPRCYAWSLVFLGPAIGLAFLEVTLLAAYLHFGPLSGWGNVYAIGVGSLALASIFYRYISGRRSSSALSELPIRPALILMLFGSMAYLIIALPALANGIQYAVYRSTGSDAFVYASMADNFRSNSLPDLLDLTSTPKDLAALEGNSTALFTARFFSRYLPAGAFLAQGFVAEFFNLVSHRIGHLLSCVGLVSMGMAATAMLLGAGLRGVVAYAAGFFILANPFARLMLELDATAQILSFGTVLAFIFFWAIGREEEGFSYTIPAFAALCAVALCVTYHPFVPILILAAVIDVVFSRKISVLFFHLRTALLVIVWLAVTGQLVWVMASFLSTAMWISAGAIAGDPAIVTFLKIFPKLSIAYIYGFFNPLPYSGPFLDTLEKLIQFGLGVAFALLGGATVLLSLFHLNKKGIIYIVSVCILSLGGFILFSIIKPDDYLLGKLLLTIQPLLCIVTFWMLYKLIERLNGFWHPMKLICTIGIVAIAIVFPLSMFPTWSDVSSVRNAPLNFSKFKISNFDFSPIHSVLTKKSGVFLSVDVPDTDDWRLTFTVGAEMQRYNPAYVSGYIYDNREDSSRLSLPCLPAETEFLLTTELLRDRIYRIGWDVVAQNRSTVLLIRADGVDGTGHAQ